MIPPRRPPGLPCLFRSVGADTITITERDLERIKDRVLPRLYARSATPNFSEPAEQPQTNRCAAAPGTFRATAVREVRGLLVRLVLREADDKYVLEAWSCARPAVGNLSEDEDGYQGQEIELQAEPLAAITVDEQP